MHLKFSHNLLKVFLPILLSTIVQSQFYSSFDNLDNTLYFSSLNFTREKRQLFREDIPDHRPLSGNVYANEHGFPHPGRWSDGIKNRFRPTPNLPPAHSQYVDMLEGNRHGNRYGRYQHGVFGGDYNGGPNSVSFGSNVLHSGGGGNSGGGGEGGFSGSYGAPVPIHGHEVSPPPEPDYDGPSHGQIKGSNYGVPHNHESHEGHGGLKDNEPKAVIHYHPVQYGTLLNLPDLRPSYGPPEPSSGYGTPGAGLSSSYGPPRPTSSYNSPPSQSSHYGPPRQPYSYGPPNHMGGPPLGIPNIQTGFVPSTGPFDDSPKGHHSPPRQHQRNPYQFDPFKFFSQGAPANPENVIEHDVPIPLPIIAQFHSAKPVKFTKVKHPIHIVYAHNSHGPPKRRPYHQHHFLRRPNKPHWLFDHSL